MRVNSVVNYLGYFVDSGYSLGIWLDGVVEVPSHFHVTEVGVVQKNFIDCGGCMREGVVCVLQVWVGRDVDHRLSISKLLGILSLADKEFTIGSLLVEVEYGYPSSQYELDDIVKDDDNKVLKLCLRGKRTACLAPEKCGGSISEVGGCC